MSSGIIEPSVDPVGEETEPDLRHIQISEVVDQIAPRVVQAADRRDKCDYASNLQLIGVHHPASDQQCGHDLQMTAEVHQKIHRKLELKYSHVEPQHTIDPLRVRALWLGRGGAPL